MDLKSDREACDYSRLTVGAGAYSTVDILLPML